MLHRKMTPKQAQEHLLRARKVRSKLWRQKNVIEFYEQIRDQSVEMGELPQTRTERTISFATPKPVLAKPTFPNGNSPSGRNSISIQRNILRAPLYNSLAEENYVDTRPPDWEGQGGAGYWEINVAPLDAEFAEDDDGPRRVIGGRQGSPRNGRKSKKPPRQPPPQTPAASRDRSESQNTAGLVTTAI